MSNIPAEIIKEFRVEVNGLDHSVKGRIIKSIKGDSAHLYLGELSHYCRPSEKAADVYYPSLLANDINSAEHLVLRYLESFTTLNVVANEDY